MSGKRDRMLAILVYSIHRLDAYALSTADEWMKSNTLWRHAKNLHLRPLWCLLIIVKTFAIGNSMHSGSK